MKSLSAWVMTFATVFAALLLAATAMPQSTSAVEDVYLTEVDVHGAPQAPLAGEHEIYGGLLRGNLNASAPDIWVCAQEILTAGGIPVKSCSNQRGCINTHDCNATLEKPLLLTSQSAAVIIEIYDPGEPPQYQQTSRIEVPNVGTYEGKPYTDPTHAGLTVTVRLNTSYAKAAAAAKTIAKAVQTGKVPLPLPGPSNFGEGAKDAYSESVSNYGNCLNAAASDPRESGLVQRVRNACGLKTGSDYNSCVAGLVGDVNPSAVTSCREKVGQGVLDTAANTTKSYLCGIVNWGAAILGTKGCSTAAPAGSGAPPLNDFQQCVVNYAQDNQALAAKASASCSGMTTAQWEYCMQGVFCPTPNVAITQTVQQRNAERATCQAWTICLNKRKQ